MFVAKLPGSMYATDAMNARPAEGRRAPKPRRTPSISAATAGGLLDEHLPGQPKGHVHPLAPEPHLHRALILSRRQDFEPGAGQQAAALELAQAIGIVVRHRADHHPLAGGGLAQ